MRRPPRHLVVNEARSKDSARPRRSEAGDTLIEVLLALVVLGVASLAILLAFNTSIWGSSDYKNVRDARHCPQERD